MAVVRAIFQPIVAADTHADALRELLNCGWARKFILSSAFSNSAGVKAVAADINAVSDKCRLYIGIRNGATTAQGVSALLKTGAEVYVLDTATRMRIFHPKVFIARGPDRAAVIIGSSNLTHAGLFNNIEAGAHIELDLADAADRAFVRKLEKNLEDLPIRFPKHCYEVTSGRQIVEMMREGLLEDERDLKAAAALGVSRTGGAEGAKPKLELPFKAPPARTHRRRKPLPPPGAAPAIKTTVPHYGSLVWAKPDLPKGDLQLLRVGNSSGVLRLTQAKFEIDGARIDQTNYFRHDVFGALAWAKDPRDPEKEMTHASFSLVIEGIYVGDFELKLSHKPAWEAGQGNYTTGLHWGEATEHIKKAELIGRTLRLFEPALPGSPYIIEID